MFAQEAREYIEKLIRLQKKIEEKGYRYIDHAAVKQARTHLKKQLDFYPYETDEKMRRFWDNHRDEIRGLIPSESHRCYNKLMSEFITLQNQ
jgi:4-hydroxyphenylpyruvate dioxygenase-like putative hemolysin